MKKKNMIAARFWTRFMTAVLALTVAGLLVSCATTGDRGTLQRDRDLNNRIMAYEVLPEHNYYFSGSFGRPNAILAIHKDYQLVSNLWQSVEVNSGQMEKWISAIAPEAMRGSSGFFAAYILNPAGERVGFWYSIQDTTRINFLEGNKIEVFTPDLHQPESGAGRMRRRF